MRLPMFKLHAMLLAPIALAATACAPSPVISASSSPCSTLVPAEWRNGVAHAPPPAEVAPPTDASPGAQIAHALAVSKAWIAFGTAEAGQLEKANGRTGDALGIVERCEARDREAVKRSRARFLGVL